VTVQLPPDDDQRDVIAFLSDPASYGLDPPQAVVRVDAHCSIVFLAGGFAYKLKRAIRYAALDYTTRESRRTACEAELVLNRRTAPELYLAVRSISRDPAGRLAFDAPGPPLDHVVVMHRFDQAALFDRMASAGTLTPALMIALGRAVARLHRAAEPTPQFGGFQELASVIAQNERELARVAPALDGARVSSLGEASHAALRRCTPLLEARRLGNKVRRCHGDLRLANIVLFHDEPTLFDCIEFSDRINCIDVLFDLAFLLMDLLLLDRGDLANAVFNAYLDEQPETDGLQLLPLFLALRAATRSYALAGAVRRRTDPVEQGRLAGQARRHIAAGIRFLAPEPPRLILLGGSCGAFARALAAATPPAPGARLLRYEPGLDTACATIEAGCSVVVMGVPAEEAVRDRAPVPPLAIWCGPTPPAPDLGDWQWAGTAEREAALLALAAKSGSD
jgi:aminoglycoside phosphotransferase family enzyme